MSSLVILGAGGFTGQALINQGCSIKPIKAVARAIPSYADITQKGMTWFAADLLSLGSLNEVIAPGDVVINLAYTSTAGKDENLRLIDNIIEACFHCQADRLVHCSTAVVAGATLTCHVDESTPCVPLTPYEQTKWAIEQRILTAASRGLDVGILRPTAIVGPGGQNLLKLSNSLQYGSRIVNYLRASLFGRRPMHLVPVRDVAAALLHLAVLPAPLHGDVYIVSSDDDPENNFQSVENIVLRSLGLESRKFPLLPVPINVLSLLLNLLGRSDANIARTYDAAKLRATNFKPVDTIAKAVREFGEDINKDNKRAV